MKRTPKTTPKYLTDAPVCHDSRKCFAKFTGQDGGKKCSILNMHYNDALGRTRKTRYEDGECPFCKVSAIITNGKTYPYVDRSK